MPSINEALEKLDFEWVGTEPENPGLFRLAMCQNMHSATANEAILAVLRRAYKSADGWSISGLQDLQKEEIRYVTGIWNSEKMPNRPPALKSICFEPQPGHVSGKIDDGWKVVSGDDSWGRRT